MLVLNSRGQVDFATEICEHFRLQITPTRT